MWVEFRREEMGKWEVTPPPATWLSAAASSRNAKCKGKAVGTEWLLEWDMDLPKNDFHFKLSRTKSELVSVLPSPLWRASLLTTMSEMAGHWKSRFLPQIWASNLRTLWNLLTCTGFYVAQVSQHFRTVMCHSCGGRGFLCGQLHLKLTLIEDIELLRLIKRFYFYFIGDRI